MTKKTIGMPSNLKKLLTTEGVTASSMQLVENYYSGITGAVIEEFEKKKPAEETAKKKPLTVREIAEKHRMI